jgi:uncharacterized membrane protein YkvA (DUF1232 family)
MNTEHNDYYLKIRAKIKDWSVTKQGMNHEYLDYVLLAPDLFHLLVKLSLDPRINPVMKVKLLAVLAYFISPIDFLPEAILGPVGYIDDIALTAYVVNNILKDYDSSIINEHWAGEINGLQTIKKIVSMADDMLGSGLWKKVKSIIK